MSIEEYAIAALIFLTSGSLLLCWAVYRKYYSVLNNEDKIKDLQSKIRLKHILICIASIGLWSDFFKGKKYIKLAFFTYLLSLPWVGLSSLICHLIFVKIFPLSDFLTAANITYYQLLWNTDLFILIQLSSWIVVPIYEEILIRGFIQNYFVKCFNPFMGILAASLIFSLLHYRFGYGSTNTDIVIPIFISSLFIGYLYQKTGSLVSCIVFHMTTNLISYLPLLMSKFGWMY
jgi:membrane protease YdiL (CAAX protease family)